MVGERCRSGGGDSSKQLAKVCEGPERTARDRASLLDLIHGFYKAALVRLPLQEMPELAPRLLKAGLCFGFMDPVSNIIVNTVSYRHPPTGKEAVGGARKRKRKERSAKAWRKAALSRIVTDISNVSSSGPDPTLLPTMSIAVRSLQSLVAFLVCNFRYLFTATALEYLLLAKADLLTAVQLIQQDRDSDTFSVASPVAKVALSCAVLAGCHPKPSVLAADWQAIYHHLDLVSNALAADRIMLSTGIRDMYALLKNLPQEPTNRTDPLRLATDRIVKEVAAEKPRVIGARIMRSILLDQIHGFYIVALARLPREGLQRHHHRSLLKAGHCYGPMDPVSNIILNTIWYDKVFPVEAEFEVDAILSSSLIRIACRSMCGLVAFLRSHFDTLSDLDALWYLRLANANLEHAVKILQQQGHTLSGDRRKAYKAAAKAGWHPSPDAHVEFALSINLPTKLSLLLQADSTLSSGDVEHLSQFLSVEPCASIGSLKPVLSLSKSASKMLSGMKKELEDEENSIIAKVKAALKKYAQLRAEPAYELHAICGVNADVVHTGTFKMHYGWLRKSPVLYQYCHVNFLASPEGSHPLGKVPTLFFLECSNDEDKNDELSCWPVVGSSTDAGRCVYCEIRGAKIVHPAFKNYHGQDADFEKIVLGEHVMGWTSDNIVRDGIEGNNFVGILEEEDCIYFDRLRDAKYAKHLNEEAKDGACPRLCC